ncbi:MAG: DUF1707 domain-containing protein [Actinobacteria bacterium]|nr:DUF1707 domain-containing protein [Actinomycetota bacterium]
MAGDQPSGNGGRAVQRAAERVEVPAVVTESSAAVDGSPAPTPGELRIGDRERQEVVDRLRLAVGSGHLTLDEFAERVDAALRATTASELRPVVADLPGSAPGSLADAATPTTDRDTDRAVAPDAIRPSPTGARSSVVAIMSGSHTRGRWRVAPVVRAFAFWGSATVDLRHALIETAVVDIHATAVMGGVTVIVPEGIPVELDGFVLMGGASNRTRLDGVLPGAPTIRVHASGLWGGVDVRTKRSKADRAKSERSKSERSTAQPSTPGREASDTLRAVASALDEVAVPSTRAPEGPGVDLPEGTLTIMFTDIVDSTASVEAMGDQRWSNVVAAHDRTLRAAVGARGGTVVKGNGDGYLVVFPSARQAVLAGLEVRDGAAVPLRIGLHTGEVVRQDGDVYGRNVIAASRIAGVAGPGEVVVSALTKDLVDSAGDLLFSEGRSVELKGLAQPWTVHEVAVDRGTATAG